MLLKFGILAFLSIVWGTTWAVIKISLIGLPPFSGAAARFILALIFLVLFGLLAKRSMSLPSGAFKYTFITAFLVYPIDYGLIYWAEQYLDSGVTSIFFATFPLFTGILASFVFRIEAFNPMRFIGLILGFAGIVIVFYDQLVLTHFDTMVLISSILVIICALSTAVSTLLVKTRLSHLTSMQLTVHQMIYGLLMLMVIAGLSGEVSSINMTPPVWWAVIYLGIVGSAIAFVLYYYLLRQISPVSLSLIIYVTPVVAVFSGWMFLDEQVTVQMLIGSAIVLIGIAVSEVKR